MNSKNIYINLDEVRNEIIKRWHNLDLKEKIEKELGLNFWSEFKQNPRGLLWRNLTSPDNGFTFFLQCSNYINVEPLAFEFLGDVYLSINEEKKGMGRLHIELEDGKKAIINIMDLHRWNKKIFSNIIIKSDELLIDFHHNLLRMSGYKIEVKDKTDWIKKIGGVADWYYFYFLHFVAHGVLFESYEINDARENKFFREIVEPSFDKIEQKFGLKPLIVRLYPDYQGNEEEDFYWWSYSPHINDCIINYAKKHNLFFQWCK